VPASLRERLRVIVFFTPWVSIPLGLLGVLLALTYPLSLVTRLAWICDPIALMLALLLGLWLRPRYRLAIVDSSPLGVLYWLQKRG
jgi:hypothetical protein